MGRNGLFQQENVLEFINQIIMKMSSGVFVLDRKTANIITCNDSFVRIHGYTSHTEVEGEILWRFFMSKDTRFILNKLEEEGHFQGEIRAFTQYQDIITIDLIILDIPRVDMILGLVRDITKQRETEERLKESEAKYRAFIETIREGLMIVNAQEAIAYVNPVLCDVLEYTKEELISMNLAEITYSESFELIRVQLTNGELRENGHLEVKMKSKSGREKTFLISTAPLYDSKSNYTGAIAVCIDVTDRYFDSNQLAETRGVFLRMMLNETSEQLLRAKGRLDILHSETSLLEQRERIEKVVSIVETIERLNHQINELASLRSIFDFAPLFISVLEFYTNLDELLTPIGLSKGCQIKFNHLIEYPYLYKCPYIVSIAIEQIIRDSLTRNSRNITVDLIVISKNKMRIDITDDGKAFFSTPETPDISNFLMSIYLANVLLRQIGGKLNINDILPKEGLQISLIFPLKPIEI